MKTVALLVAVVLLQPLFLLAQDTSGRAQLPPWRQRSPKAALNCPMRPQSSAPAMTRGIPAAPFCCRREPVAPPVSQVSLAAGTHASWRQLLIQNGGNLAMDEGMRLEITHGNYFRKWFQSVDNWRWAVWNDNDPFLDDYIAHPMQGAVYELIYIQNDDRGKCLPLENTARYWKSRLRALAWSTFWSTEWKIGPLSEAAIGNTGLYPYYSRESHGMTNGTEVVDFVMTPIGGFVWVLGEEALDRVLVSRLRRVSRNRVWTAAALAILTPTPMRGPTSFAGKNGTATRPRPRWRR